MTQSHFIVDVDFSYQHEDLPAIASHNIHVELRPGLDGVKVREAIEQFIEANFGMKGSSPVELRCPVTVNAVGQHVCCSYHPRRAS